MTVDSFSDLEIEKKSLMFWLCISGTHINKFSPFEIYLQVAVEFLLLYIKSIIIFEPLR